MNNSKMRALACITLALCSLSSLEARRGKDGAKYVDPLVGTWNLELGALPVGMTTEEATEAVEEVGRRITLEGVGTFHKDGTVVVASIPKEPNDTQCGIFSTMSYGIWKNMGKGQYKIILSSVTNPPGTMHDFRGKTVARVELSPDCKRARLNGRFSMLPLDDICFESRTRAEFRLNGRACKLSHCS